MGGPKRHFERGAVYYLTNETIRGQALFTPNERITRIIENNLAWAADKHDIDLICFGFEPDSFGMLVASRHLNISDFMCDFEGLTAREVNAVHGETGKFYAGRYDCSKVETDMQLEVASKLIASSHSRGFVSHPRDWTGSSSWTLHETGAPLVGERVDRRWARELRRKNSELSLDASLELATTTHSVRLARLPALGHLSEPEYREVMLGAVENRVVSAEDSGCGEAGIEGSEPECAVDFGEVEVRTLYSLHPETLRFPIPVGAENVAAWPPTFGISRKVDRKPLYLTRNTSLRERFRKARERRNLEYAWAAKRLRNGDRKPRFPKGMIPPHQTRPVGATRPPPRERRGRQGKVSARAGCRSV